MAILPSFLKYPASEGEIINASETYIRNIINSEAQLKAVLGKTYDKRIGY